MIARWCFLALMFAMLGAGCSHRGVAKAARPVVVAQAEPPAAAAPPPSTAPNGLLTIVEADGAQKIDPSGGRFDFGEFSMLDTPKLEHIFTLRNDNAMAVVIEKIKTTCGCTSAVIDGNPDQKFPLSVAPGKEIHLRSGIIVSHLADGPFTKSILITLAGRDTTTHTLDLSGKVKPAVLLDPPDVDFGDVQAGEVHPETITVKFDNKILAGGWNPKVTCSVADVTVRALPGSGPAQDDPTYTARQFQLIAGKQMKMGSFWGQLVVSVNPASGLKEPLRAHNGFIHGKVLGDFTASPDYVSFGSPAEGTAVKQTITITGKSAEAVRGIQIHSTSPWVTASAVPDPKTPTVIVLNLSLSPNAPAGGFHSEVIARSKTGSVMSLAVQAFVRAAPK